MSSPTTIYVTWLDYLIKNPDVARFDNASDKILALIPSLEDSAPRAIVEKFDGFQKTAILTIALGIT